MLFWRPLVLHARRSARPRSWQRRSRAAGECWSARATAAPTTSRCARARSGAPSSTASSARGSWSRRATTTGGGVSRAGAKARSGRPIPARGSFPMLAALLARGKLLYLFFDMPGSRETRFLGKTAMLADGTARLAAATDALVVPLRARRIGKPRVAAGCGAARPARARRRRGAAPRAGRPSRALDPRGARR